jgi:serine/threonine-protein kinase
VLKGLANVGDVLAGKYRVDKILGLGGMGMVVAATHLELDQQVALKFMLPAALESPEASARFLREARAAGKLTSEHVCRVTDVGRFDSGEPYIVMEYLEGYDLGTMLKKRGPLRVGPAVDYLLQACEGLAEAHAQGIVHRDLKPDNLYLSARADGGHIIKVLDFGISKSSATGIATRTGDILGSPAYMAPEQMRSTKDVDSRADVWSLGAVMYQLLTGRLPFTGDSLPTLCLSVLNDDPIPPNEFREDIPDGLAAVILRCLGKEPEARFSDVGELAAALGPFATPAGFGSVTRVQSALKGRQAPPDPSQTIPHGFEAQQGQGGAPPFVALPTLIETENALGPGSDLFVPRVMPARPGGVTPPAGAAVPADAVMSAKMTVPEGFARASTSPSSSESFVSTKLIPGRRKQRRRLVIAGLCGAIALVVVLIVMVARSEGLEVVAPEPTPPPQIVAPTAETPQRPQVAPSITPIEATAGAKAAGQEPGAQEPTGQEPTGQEPTGQEPSTQEPAPGDSKTVPGARPEHDTQPKLVRGKPSVKSTAKSASKDGGKAGSGSAAAKPEDPPPDPGDKEDDEDKWGRMHHDQPKEKTP